MNTYTVRYWIDGKTHQEDVDADSMNQAEQTILETNPGAVILSIHRSL